MSADTNYHNRVLPDTVNVFYTAYMQIITRMYQHILINITEFCVPVSAIILNNR